MSWIERNSSTKSDQRIDLHYGLYRIVAGSSADASFAVGYLGSKKIDVETGDSLQMAVDAMKRRLDQRLSNLRARRVGGIPTTEEFEEALAALYPKLPERMAALVAIHSRLPRATVMLKDLSQRSGLDETVILADYVRFARRIGKALQFSPIERGVPRPLGPLLTIGQVDVAAKNRSDIAIRLRPQILKALGVPIVKATW